MMATYCQRCHEQVHGSATDQPHLCADISKRLARRERQVEAVLAIVPALTREDAQAIVTRLAGIGVGEE